jgi:tetratricopeptide (TPR) repeat protein
MSGKQKLISLTLLVFTFLFLFPGCDEQQKVGKKQKVTSSLQEQKKAKLLKEISDKYENPQAHFELGKLYQQDGLWARAEDEYNITLSFDPVHREAQAARVKVLAGSGEQDKADIVAGEYISQASSSALGSVQLAEALQQQGLDEYALRCFQQALRLAPDSARINRDLGYYYLRKGDKNLAKDYLSRSFNIDPMQPEVAEELGRMGVVIETPHKSTKADAKKVDAAESKTAVSKPKKK